MTATIALVQVIISMLPQITEGIEHLIAFIKSVRTAAKQTGEWTDEMETQWQATLWADAQKPEQQPDRG